MSQATRAVRGSWGLTVGWDNAPPPPGPMMRQRASVVADPVKVGPAASTRIRRVPGMRLIGLHGRTRPDRFEGLAEKGAQMIAIHARDDAEVDALGAGRLALAVERAGAEALSVRGGHQAAAAARALGLALRQEAEVGELGPHEERGAVHHEVGDDGEGAGPEGLQGNGGAVAERAHREQARGGAGQGPVWAAV